MARALDLAAIAWGRTHPNPMVGALIVEGGQVVAEGFHEKDGGPHAEIVALRALGRRPKPDAILVVTLEPCSTVGRTGACTSAILEAGIRRVIVGAKDPNPAHAGRGLELLRNKGVHVVQGVMESRCEDLNLLFNFRMRHGRPMIALKVALTLDGCLAVASGHSRWITGAPARVDVMGWRRLFPAIAVGRGTIERDNPALTSRGVGGADWCPIRFVFDSRLKLATTRRQLKIFSGADAARTIVVCAGADPAARSAIEAHGAQVWECGETKGRVNLRAWRDRVAAEGLVGVYVETGPTLFQAFVDEALCDYLFAYHAPILVGDPKAPRLTAPLFPMKMDGAARLADPRVQILGSDTLVRGFLYGPGAADDADPSILFKK